MANSLHLTDRQTDGTDKHHINTAIVCVQTIPPEAMTHTHTHTHRLLYELEAGGRGTINKLR